jgi:hypothetical protein
MPRSRVASGALALLLAVSARGAPETTSVELSITHPPAGTRIDPAEPALVVGNAFQRFTVGAGLDVVVAIDVSTSSGAHAGADVDGDGRLEPEPFAGDDSVFAAELLAASRVVDELIAGGHRVALVRFSGKPPEWWFTEEPAELVQPLSTNREALRAALARFRERRPWGLTDFNAALDTSCAALGLDGSRARVVVFFTDGVPTRPHEEPEDNLRASIEAADRCAAAGIRVHTVAIGMEALANPHALIEIADRTRGLFAPVESPADLQDVAAWVARASVRDVRVRNLTTGEPAQRTHVAPDGSWSALVALREGDNRIEVSASALGGDPVRAERVLIGRPGAGQALPEALGEHRRMLLEDRLARLQQRVLELSEQVRRDLVEDMKRTRTRKEVELGVEKSRTRPQ